MRNVRDDLIKTMFESLYTEGYYACNLNAILKRAGTSKGGMYHHFDSKQSLAIASVEEVLGDFITKHWEEPIKSSENGIQTLLELISNLSSFSLTDELDIDCKFGCPFNNLIQEVSALDAKFAKTLVSLFNRWEESIIKALMANKKLLRIDIDIQHVAAFIIASIEGSFSYAKIHQSKEAFDASMLQTILYIKSLLR